MKGRHIDSRRTPRRDPIPRRTPRTQEIPYQEPQEEIPYQEELDHLGVPTGNCSSFNPSPLIKAIKQNNISLIQELIGIGANVNVNLCLYQSSTYDVRAASPLMIAIIEQLYHFIPILLDAGANINVNIDNLCTYTPLAIAILFDAPEVVIKDLIKTGAIVPDLTFPKPKWNSNTVAVNRLPRRPVYQHFDMHNENVPTKMTMYPQMTMCDPKGKPWKTMGERLEAYYTYNGKVNQYNYISNLPCL